MEKDCIRLASGETVENATRTPLQLRARQWDVYGDDDEALVPIATPETKVPALPSVYAAKRPATLS